MLKNFLKKSCTLTYSLEDVGTFLNKSVQLFLQPFLKKCILLLKSQRKIPQIFTPNANKITIFEKSFFCHFFLTENDKK